MSQGGEKSHDPSPHRREKAREEGQVARSQDLGSAVVLIAALAIFWFSGESLLEYLQDLMRKHLGGEAWVRADRQWFVHHWSQTLRDLASALLPMLVLLALAGAAISVMQVRFLFLPQKLAPQYNRLDVIKNFQNLLGLSSWVRLGFGLFKLTVVGAVAYASVAPEAGAITALAALPFAQIVSYLFGLLFGTMLRIAGALLVLALLEYFYQWWKQEQDLKMTTQEVREEFKNLQGDPQVLSRRRQVQRQMAMNSLSKAVPKSTFVVTNPTELAVAIQYDAAKEQLPIVVAKGAGAVAQRIRRLALENGIPVVERKELARALYKTVDVGQPAPRELWAAVSEVIRYVYQLKGMKLPEAPAA